MAMDSVKQCGRFRRKSVNNIINAWITELLPTHAYGVLILILSFTLAIVFTRPLWYRLRRMKLKAYSKVIFLSKQLRMNVSPTNLQRSGQESQLLCKVLGPDRRVSGESTQLWELWQ